MTLQASGPISLADIAAEFGGAAPHSMSEYYGAAAGIPGSGAIDFAAFYGKSSVIEYTSIGTRNNVNIANDFGNPTEPGNFIWYNDGDCRSGSLTYAVQTGTLPVGSTLTIVNRGFIRGRGGNAGSTSDRSGSQYWHGQPGREALFLSMSITLDNAAGYIYGGGGGGANEVIYSVKTQYLQGDGGGGGAGANGGAKGYGGGNRDGQAGGLTTGGTGYNGNTAQKGGDVGMPGGNSAYPARSAGGAAGKAIALNGYSCSITAGNNSTQIKGAVA